MDFGDGFGSPSTASHGRETESKTPTTWERADHIHRIATAASPATCPHSKAANAPYCWDCAEAGHVAQWDDFADFGHGDGFSRQKGLYEHGRYVSWSASNASTLGTPSTLPEWHPPEPGIEPVYSSMFARGAQSEAPEWLPPEQGLEVVQPDATEKIPVTPRRSVFDRVFKTPRVCGLRRRTFWIVVCAVLLIIAIVLGVVLGLKLRHQTANPSPTSTTSPQATGTSSTGTTPTLTGMPACPGANGTTYADPATNVDFTRECGLSHDGSDLSHHIAYSMDDCVASCAQTSLCMGAVWINAGTQGTDNNWCWLHTDMSQKEYIRVNQYAQSATRVDT